MASEYDPTDQQDTEPPDLDQGHEQVLDPSVEQSLDQSLAAPADGTATDVAQVTDVTDVDRAPAARTRTRKTAAKRATTTGAKTPRVAKSATATETAAETATETATDTATEAATEPAKKTARATKTGAKKAGAKKTAAKKPSSVVEEPADRSGSATEVREGAPVSEPDDLVAQTSSSASPKRGRRRAARPAEQATAAEVAAAGPEPAPSSLVDEDALRFDLLEAPAATDPVTLPVAEAAEVTEVTEVTDDIDEVTADASANDAPSPAEGAPEAAGGAYGPLFQAPTAPSRRRRRASAPSAAPDPEGTALTESDRDTDGPTDHPEVAEAGAADSDESADAPRRRRRRGGKGRRGRSSGGAAGDVTDEPETSTTTARLESDGDTDNRGGPGKAGPAGTEAGEGGEDEGGSTTRRRTRRRRRSGASDSEADEPGVTTKVRESRRDEVTALKGSTRLEAKKQRRREGREAGRRRTVITEAEFLARRESVERVMVVRHVGDRTQIGVLEDAVLVEHYISKETSVSMAGNIYLGRVQNVLPSMEAAFVDIGKGRNAVLYAGEVNWDAAGLEANQPKRIENALTSGESVLVQVTKDPIGHKGARLTSQISLPGRYLVYVPNSGMTGISRKLPDTERARLKKILKEVVPDTAGVIVRTAAEGASEEELKADVERLTATWAEITDKAEAATGGGGKRKNKGGSAPLLLHGEPDLTVRVIRDIFNEDFAQLVVAGDQAWQEVSDYVTSVAPDLAERASKWTSSEDLFTHYRVDEQIAKAMDRKVWLPSGGSLVIDRTEAMTVVDVNTGKFIGSGGNLEETVTKNNLEAAEEIVRQLRLRDVGGIIVIDFIDMVLESNRDLVVRRLLECLGRDRTKHQVAEVTSLGLVQMTRKRVGSGLIEVFSETCEVCGGRGIIVHSDPVDKSSNGYERTDHTDHTDNTAAGAGRAPTGRARGRSTHVRTPELPAPARHGGPTPAQIAAAAHAAAMKSNGGGADGDGALGGGQDGPLDIVLELDLEEVDTALPGNDDVEWEAPTIAEQENVVGESPVVQASLVESSVVQSSVVESSLVKPSVVDPASDVAPVAAEPDVQPDAQPDVEREPTPEPAPDAYAPAASPPSRPRRHRGRVVAPAGPPRAVSPGGGAGG